MKELVKQFTIRVFEDRNRAGYAAGTYAAEILTRILERKGSARMIFAAAPSQNEMLETLTGITGINWHKVTAFHMDEYIGLSPDAPQRFSHYLHTHLFNKVSFAAVHLIDGNDPKTLCEQYTEKLTAAPVDIVCMGVGENGHIAFNDPPVADFRDPKIVKIVDLDISCRQQQVNDGCFPDLGNVPKQAVSLTVPALMSADYLVCTVLGIRKRNAVHKMLGGEISTECPASFLRKHNNVSVFLDQEAWGGFCD